MNELFKGIPFARMDQKYLTCFFANDSLLFCRGNLEEVKTIQSILGVYENASGQQINSDKTTLFFGKSVNKTTKNSLKGLLGVPKIKQYETYLGFQYLWGKIGEQV